MFATGGASSDFFNRTASLGYNGYMGNAINLTDLGYDAFFESGRKELDVAEYPVARVIAEYKEAYRVKNANSEYPARITGKQMFAASKREDYPAVGDWVAITELPDGNAVIRAVLPRKTVLKKKYSGRQDMQIIAANIDVAFIVQSVDRDFSLNRFERYLVLAYEAGIRPVLVLNKTDLVLKEELEETVARIKNRFGGVEVACTSAVGERGFADIADKIAKGKTYCFLGSSGVGKSSLINRLLGRDEIKTGEINAEIERGRHTTTSREMYFLENGGVLIDNPGTRAVGIAASGTGLENVFDDIGRLSRECRYTDCTHTHEPGCAVLHALGQNKLDQDKYDNYLKLKKESDFYRMSEGEKREKDRKFGKSLKKYHDMTKDD